MINNYLTESIVNNSTVFLSCMNYDLLAKNKLIMENHCISLLNKLAILTEQVKDCTSSNAYMIDIRYLSEYKKSNNLYNENNSTVDITSIIKLTSEISDAELELYSEYDNSIDIHSVSKKLSSIVSGENTDSENLLKKDRSYFSAYVTSLESTYDDYCDESNALRESISILRDIINSIIICMRYISVELKFDKGRLKAFSALSVYQKKQRIIEFIPSVEKELM